MGQHILLYIDEKKANMLQDLIDEVSVMASLLGYEIEIIGDRSTSYDIIHFAKEDNVIGIYFQHTSQKTTCYCLHNGEQVSINRLKKLF